ncbi:MAG: GspH/FimT family pseudopilin [Gemmatimonadota bacterium]
MQKGVTLLELIFALAITGILVVLVMPAVAGLRDRYLVGTAAQAIASAHNRARIQAVLQSRVVDLEVRPDSLLIRATSGATAIPLWSEIGPAQNGITLGSPTRILTFAPTGITLGFANATFVLTRGSARRQVIVSRLGRVRIIP